MNDVDLSNVVCYTNLGAWLYVIREVPVSAGVVEYRARAGIEERYRPSAATGGQTSVALARRGLQLERPQWHAPWKLMRVISGHLGWVRSVAVEPANQWFATGSNDRTIKAPPPISTPYNCLGYHK